MAEQIRARPRPSASYQRIHNKGPRWLHRTDPSDSWWENGALVVDDDGPTPIRSADHRHPFPEAAAGGFLVHSTSTLAAGAPGRPLKLVALFVAAPPELGQRVLLVLPYQGFGEGVQGSTEMIEFARAAGLRFTERDFLGGAQEKEYPGMAHAPNLRWAIYDQAHRDRSLVARLRRAGARVGLGMGHRERS